MWKGKLIVKYVSFNYSVFFRNYLEKYFIFEDEFSLNYKKIKVIFLK